MKLPRFPAAVIFDMDGLLFDTEIIYRKALFAAATEGCHVMTDDLHRQMLGCPWAVIRTQLLQHYGDQFPIDAFRASWLRHFNLISENGLAVKAGVIELLDELDRLSIPRAIATSSFRESAEHHLDRHRIRGRFHFIVAHGDYADSKPAPDPYLKAAKLLKTDPYLCLALEDSHNGVRSAAAAGMMTIMVPDLMPPTSEMRDLCVAVASDLHDVRDLMAGARY
ncbi:HAD family hydrolase [Agrobacterium tumefaciens]|uniref:HAD family hydrolase n=1 Tax=Agrobacterium tumefaciens TaxID=358 RepID=UPI001572C58F|nr:HAD family phosphatase [Agrobacterium tumefaciens]